MATPSPFADARDWIERHLGGEIRDAAAPRVRPWGFVVRLESHGGESLFFKACPDALRHEAAVTARLARIHPERIPQVIAYESSRGWLLLRDAGPTLRDLLASSPQAAHWERVLAEYAAFQLETAPVAGELLALGCPDLRFDALRERTHVLLGALERGERIDLSAQLEARCSALAQFGVPDAIQHDDLHDGNVFVSGNDCRIFDWGDASVAHPFYSLTIPLRAAAQTFGWSDHDPGTRRLRTAYLEPWGRYGETRELERALDLASPLAMLSRAHTWYALSLWVEPEPAGVCRASALRWLREAGAAFEKG